MAKKKTSRDRDNQDGLSESVDFEEAVAEVEQIVGRLESGDCGLGEALKLYETGVKRLKQCLAILDDAENRVTLLSGFDAEGNPVTEPIEQAGDESLEDKQRKRGRRRSVKTPPKQTTAKHTRNAPPPQGGVNGGDSLAEDDLERGGSVDDSPGLF